MDANPPAEPPAGGDTIDDGARMRFESAWRSGKPVSIEACLGGLSGPERLAALEQLVRAEIGLTWQRGRGSTVESYLGRFPELGGDGERVRRLVLEEAWVRHRFGDAPAVAAYTGRFPELFAEPTAQAALDDITRRADQQAGPLGRYRIDVELGHGGFGTVWAARDPQLGRVVALKQLHAHIASREDTRRRFVEEARVAARLEHPGVVPVYELGESGGTPFFAMKLVRGETLYDAIARMHAPGATPDPVAHARLIEAFLAVARTMAFAHANAVIHRDLKPQNVILGDYGETVILDWGLAKSLDERELRMRVSGAAPDDIDSGITQAGAVLGTPAYMAPEQARGEIEHLDQKSDVFSLGCMLYEVLTGKLPFPGDNALEIMASVAGDDPPARTPRQHDARVPRALEAICLKALDKDRARRYPDAGALAADLERHLAGAPVSAHRETLLERASRFARRHKGLVLTTGLALVVLAAGAVIAAVMVDGERSQARHAEQVAREAEAVADKARNQAEVARDAALHHAYVASLALALRAWEDGDLGEADRQLAATPDDRRGWELRWITGLVHGALREINDTPARRVAVDPGGAFVAVAGEAAEVTIHRADGRGRASGPTPLARVALGQAPDELVLLSGGRVVVRAGGSTRAFTWTEAGEVREAAPLGEVLRLARGADGRLARVLAPSRAVLGDDPTAAGVALHLATPGAGDADPDAVADLVAFAPDLSRAVTIDWAQRMRATDLTSGALVWDAPLPDLAAPQVAYGARIVVAQDRRFGGRVTRFDPATGQALEPPLELERPATALAVDPERDRYVVGTIDGMLHVVVDGLERNVLRAHKSPVRDVALMNDELVSAASDGVRVFEPERPQRVVEASGYALGFAPDGRWLDGIAREHDRWTGEAIIAPARRSEAPGVMPVAYADRVAIAGRDGRAVVMLVGGELWLGARRGAGFDKVGVAELFVVRDDGRVVSFAADTLTTWDADERAAVGEPVAAPGEGAALALVPGVGAAPVTVVRGPPGHVAAVLGDGRLVALSGPSGPVTLRARDGAIVGALAGPFERVSALAFTPDGTRLVVGDGPRLGLWDVGRGLEVLSLAVPERVRAIEVSGDGRSIGATLIDGRVLVYNAAWPRDGR